MYQTSDRCVRPDVDGCKRKEVLKKHFSDVWGKSKTATPLLKGKPSKAEQITLSQEMFQNTKANKKKADYAITILVWVLETFAVSPRLSAFHRHPSLVCSLSCKLLGQHWDQALQKLAELYLGKEKEHVLRQRTVTASPSWFFSIAATFWWAWVCDGLSLYGLRLKPNTTLCLEDVKFWQVVWSTKLNL